MSVLARYGGLSAAEIYGRLDLHKHGIRERTFRLHVAELRQRTRLRSERAEDLRPEAIADLFLKWLCRCGGVKLEKRVACRMCERLGIRLAGQEESA